jgi:hypothetical protein
MADRQSVRWAASRPIPPVLYHATTPRKLARYEQTGAILPPVRGFDTVEAARQWADEKQRSVVLRIEPKNPQLLPDHHRLFVGAAWWSGHDVKKWEIAR